MSGVCGQFAIHYGTNPGTRRSRHASGQDRHLFTELRESLERPKAAQANLIQSTKMASLGQLTAGIAHEIKQPTELRQQSYATPPESQRVWILNYINIRQAAQGVFKNAPTKGASLSTVNVASLEHVRRCGQGEQSEAQPQVRLETLERGRAD
jgi:hypothetical protein